ncbi:MAG TPA: metallophosphoesterase [Hyphomonadaceae bacterium]
MLGRLLMRLGFFAAALSLALLGCASAEPQAPATVHRIVAVGDLHGDFAAWRAIAQAAGLTDSRGRWTGGKTVLVQTGDVVDRGPDGRKIIEDLMRLQREAVRARGRVVALVGNHEAMNMTGDLRYVSAADFAAYADSKSERVRQKTYEANKVQIEATFRQKDPAMTSEAIKAAWLAATPPGALEHRAAWSPTGRIGRWVAGNPAVALIDGNLFLHGGIGPAYAHLTLDEINRQVAAALAAQATAPGAIINDPSGPLWYRDLVMREPETPAAPSTPPPPSVAEQLDEVLAAFGARRMVIGHTPNLSGIVVREEGELVLIDTGISSAYGGTLTYLEILDGAVLPHVVARPDPVKKEAK